MWNLLRNISVKKVVKGINRLIKKHALNKYLITRYHWTINPYVGKSCDCCTESRETCMRMAIRGRPRDKRWKHVLRINYGRNQWTTRAPRRNSTQSDSFLLKMHECAHGEFVLQLFRNRRRKRCREKDNNAYCVQWIETN